MVLGELTSRNHGRVICPSLHPCHYPSIPCIHTTTGTTGMDKAELACGGGGFSDDSTELQSPQAINTSTISYSTLR